MIFGVLTLVFFLVSFNWLSYRAGIRIGAERKGIPSYATAINYIDEVLLPEPDDPRWALINTPPRYELGNVAVHLQKNDSEIRIYNEPKDAWACLKNNNYAWAVDKAWKNRKSFESIEGVELPTKDPQLQLKGV